MHAKHDLNKALHDLKQADEAPLISREDLTALLAAHPVAASNPNASSHLSKVHSNRTPWLVGGSLALAATAAFVAVNTWDAEPNTGEDPREQTVQNQDAPVVTAPLNDDTRPPGVRGNGSSSGAGKTDSARSANFTTLTIQLAAEQLTRFGLQYDRGRITYVEDGARITIRANGIGVVSGANIKDATTLTPIMVVIYHDQEHFSDWSDKDLEVLVGNSNQRTQLPATGVSTVNGLVGIRVALTASDVLASNVDVVLWFVGTPEVAERLPQPYRQQLQRELGLAEAPAETHFTLPDAVASPFVVSCVVFPNPLHAGVATVRLQMKKSPLSSCIITDMFGKEIAVAWDSRMLSQGQSDIPLQGLDDAPTGVYNIVMTFDGGNERIIQRLMIQR